MEAYGSFYGIYSWKLQLMEALEASTSTNSGKFHVFPWKLPLTSTKIRGNFHGSNSTSMEANLLPWKLSFHGSTFQIYFHKSKLTSMKASNEVNLLPWKWVETSMEADRRSEIGGTYATRTFTAASRLIWLPCCLRLLFVACFSFDCFRLSHARNSLCSRGSASTSCTQDYTLLLLRY